MNRFRNPVVSASGTCTTPVLAALLLGSLIWTSLGQVAHAQNTPASHYDWTPEEFTSEQYFVRKLREVGGAMTLDVAKSLDCGLLTYARIQDSIGAERVLNGAIWTSFAVRTGDFREQGTTFTPEMEALIRSTLSPAALQSSAAQAAFARLRATPGGVDAREAECVEVFNRAAGQNRAYFEQRARFVTTREPLPSSWSVEQLRSQELFTGHVNDVAARLPLDADQSIECQMIEALGISLSQANNAGAEVIAWRRQKWAVFDVRRQLLQNSGASISPNLRWMTQALSDAAAWRSAESLAWQRALPPERHEACDQAFEASLQDTRPFFEQRANLAKTN